MSAPGTPGSWAVRVSRPGRGWRVELLAADAGDELPALERALGDRWRNSAPLSPAEEGRLLRAGAAYSLAGDGAALARLKGRYAKLADSARSPDALRVALAGAGEADVASADFARAVTDADSFAAWVSAMKTRFREKPAPTGTARPPLKQAAAAPSSAAG